MRAQNGTRWSVMTTRLEAAPATDQRVQRREHAFSRSSYTLPPEMMAEASRRLGLLGLVYAIGGVLGYFSRRVLLVWSGSASTDVHPADIAMVAAIAVGIAVYVVSRRGFLRTKRFLDLGLVFEVVGAIGISAGQFWTGFPQIGDASLGLVPAECVWIVAYPLVVPNPPRQVLMASLLAASVGPFGLTMASAVSGTSVGSVPAITAYFLPNYLSAAVAYAVSRIVHQFNVRLKRAREVGSYELVERLGEGGMGEVWRAKHRLLARPAAIKLIRGDILGSGYGTRDAIVQRFEREVQDTATLGSPHTIDVYDFGTTEEGDFYYVMELLNGISLERFVQLYGPMEAARVVYLLRQACHSLGEAHARGLIHRDIKPANIFMCRLGPDDDFVKVLDFGLVKHMGASPEPLLTVEGSTTGTPAFIAPEIALGRPGVDARADIYSIGCVAYYLLTGQLVFAGDTPVAMALAHVQERPVPPSERSELDIPPALDSLILDCLAKNAADRPESAVELARCLATIVPQDAWTADTAHAWWELHRPAMAEGPGSAEESQVAPVVGHRRCWPRLDRKVAAEQLA